MGGNSCEQYVYKYLATMGQPGWSNMGTTIKGTKGTIHGDSIGKIFGDNGVNTGTIGEDGDNDCMGQLLIT